MIRGVINRFGGENYQARALRGTAMTALNYGGYNFLRLAGNLVLTRLLFPEAFGLMALVNVVLAGIAMFSDFGLRGSIVQNPRGDDPKFLNTAWTLQIGRGILLGLAVVFLAGPLADFYDAPLLEDLLLLGAIIPVIQGFNSTRMATANRHIALERLTVLALGSQLVGIIVMITLAWLLNSVWALIFGSVAAALAQAIFSHIILPGTHRNRLYFEMDSAKQLFGFGKYIFLATLASFFIQHGDRAVLGKFVSLEDLAIYNIGFFLAMVPLKFARQLNNMVIFPLYSRKPPSESETNRRKINRARFLLTGSLIFVCTVLALIGDFMVRLLYDPRFEGGGPVLVLIALIVIPQLVTLSYERLPMSAGHAGRYAFFMIGRALLLMSVTIFGAMHYGMLGAILAPLIAWVLVYPFLIWIILPYQGWDPRHDMAFAALSALVIGCVLWVHWDTLQPLLPAG